MQNAPYHPIDQRSLEMDIDTHLPAFETKNSQWSVPIDATGDLRQFAAPKP
jgi:hypothetical protein